jgi:hypothetical protein
MEQAPDQPRLHRKTLSQKKKKKKKKKVVSIFGTLVVQINL